MIVEWKIPVRVVPPAIFGSRQQREQFVVRAQPYSIITILFLQSCFIRMVLGLLGTSHLSPVLPACALGKSGLHSHLKH